MHQIILLVLCIHLIVLIHIGFSVYTDVLSSTGLHKIQLRTLFCKYTAYKEYICTYHWRKGNGEEGDEEIHNPLINFIGNSIFALSRCYEELKDEKYAK